MRQRPVERSLAPDHKIFYFTDIEGDWRRYQSAFDGRHVRLDGEDVVLEDGVQLVFGGDAVDRGSSSRAIIRSLLNAKKKYGGRVVLLGGNRDVNKWRLGTELEPLKGSRLAREVAYAGGKLLKRVTGRDDVTEDDVRDFLRKTERAEILREIFQHTMGAPGAFEFLREELAREAGVGRESVSDGDVADAYWNDIRPGGVFHEYLKNTQAAFLAGSALFVHGGLTKENLGFVPASDQVFGGTRTEPVADWVEKLNDWYRAQTELLSRFDQDENGGRLGEPLIRYQAPLPGTPRNDQSVIYGRLRQNNAEDSIDPLLPDDETCARLAGDGIAFVVFGHTPQGAAPTPVLSADRRVAFIVMDSSHDRQHHTAHLLLAPKPALGAGPASAMMRTQVHREGEMRELKFEIAGSTHAPEFLGMKTEPDGFRVKGVFGDGTIYLSKMDRHYRVHEKIMRPEDLAREKLVFPVQPAV